jgi:hypothetical protein
MQRVTLETLPDYARDVLAAAEDNTARSPVTVKVQLPGLELTAHLDHGALADAVNSAFIPSPDTGPELAAQAARILVTYPGVSAPARL